MVAEPVLAKLGDLDPGVGGDRPAAGCEAFPRRRRLVEPTQSAEQTSSIDEDPLLRPWRVEPGRGDGLRLGRGRAAEIGAVAWHPPPVFLDMVGWRGGCRRRRIEWRGEGSLEAFERLHESPLAGEGAGEAGKIAPRGRSANVRVGE